MKVQLVDPTLGKDDGKIVPSLVSYGLPEYVPAGEIIDVPVEVAGRGPHWRAAAEGDDLGFMEIKIGEGGKVTVHDLGNGLLAQLGIWARPDAGEQTPAATAKD
jgi:hypothetical protein